MVLLVLRFSSGSNNEKSEKSLNEPMDMSKMDEELDVAYNMNHPKRGHGMS